MRALLIVAVALVALTASNVSAQPASAQATDPAPELFQNSATCFRSIVQADDLFCLNRYELPTNSTVTPVSEELWCQYLTDLTGCTGNPVDPDSPWSLQPGAAFITLYEGSTPISQGQIPRIGHGLGGSYLAAGHGLTWADPTITACVESGATFFTTSESSCQTPSWNTLANTTTAQRSALGTALVSALLNLEVADSNIPPGGYVVANKINIAGRVLALETLSIIDRIVSNVFGTGVTPLVTDSFTPGAGLQLQSDIDATAVAFKTNLEDAGTELGIPGDVLGMLLFTIIGIAAFVVVRRVGGGADTNVLSVVAFLTVMLTGTLVGAVPVAVVAITALLIFIVAVMFVLRKMVFA